MGCEFSRGVGFARGSAIVGYTYFFKINGVSGGFSREKIRLKIGGLGFYRGVASALELSRDYKLKKQKNCPKCRTVFVVFDELFFDCG